MLMPLFDVNITNKHLTNYDYELRHFRLSDQLQNFQGLFVSKLNKKSGNRKKKLFKAFAVFRQFKKTDRRSKFAPLPTHPKERY